MPIFAYHCRSCGNEFQTLVMSGETPSCKSCESVDLEQQLSLIAAPSKGGEAEAAPMKTCAMDGGMCCGGGACGMAA